MRWQLVLCSALLLSACSEAPVESAPVPYKATSFVVEKSTEITTADRTELYSATALLLDPTYYNSVDGGDVFINGAPVLKATGKRGPRYSHAGSTPTQIPLRFDGTVERFSVSGSAQFPAMSDSVPSFDRPVEILVPRPTDVILKTVDLYVTWNGSPTSTDSVDILTYGPNGVGFVQRTLDDGSQRVAASDLGRIPKGNLFIVISKLHSHNGTLPDGRRYEMEVRSKCKVTARIN